MVLHLKNCFVSQSVNTPLYSYLRFRRSCCHSGLKTSSWSDFFLQLINTTQKTPTHDTQHGLRKEGSRHTPRQEYTHSNRWDSWTVQEHGKLLISVCAAIEVFVKRQTQESGEHLGVGGEEHRRLGSTHEAWNLEGRDRKGNTTGRRIHQGPRNLNFFSLRLEISNFYHTMITYTLKYCSLKNPRIRI